MSRVVRKRKTAWLVKQRHLAKLNQTRNHKISCGNLQLKHVRIHILKCFSKFFFENFAFQNENFWKRIHSIGHFYRVSVVSARALWVCPSFFVSIFSGPESLFRFLTNFLSTFLRPSFGCEIKSASGPFWHFFSPILAPFHRPLIIKWIFF